MQILFQNLLTVVTSNIKKSVEVLYSCAKSHHDFAPVEIILK